MTNDWCHMKLLNSWAFSEMSHDLNCEIHSSYNTWFFDESYDVNAWRKSSSFAVDWFVFFELEEQEFHFLYNARLHLEQWKNESDWTN